MLCLENRVKCIYGTVHKSSPISYKTKIFKMRKNKSMFIDAKITFQRIKSIKNEIYGYYLI
jgi:hypothetical protein